MRIGIRSVLASGNISIALLLGVAPVALVIPGSDRAFSQPTTGAAAQAPLYTVINLDPAGSAVYYDSGAMATSGGQQVGDGELYPGHHHHALLWRGSADSVVDLNPPFGKTYASFGQMYTSFAFAVCGGQQVGYGDDLVTLDRHALLWHGSAVSVVDLHPHGFAQSAAFGTNGEEQVGSGVTVGGNIGDGPFHALLWRGTAASVVDLHPRGFASSEALGISGEEQVGKGLVAGGQNPIGPFHALLWRGTAASVVDLHPRGFASSEASSASGEEQVGRGTVIGSALEGPYHALLWRGSAASVVDLHPRGFYTSESHGTNGEEQVGSGVPAGGENEHALLWRGSAPSVVDLHAFLPPNFIESWAFGIDAAGDIVGAASPPGFNAADAILWKRNIPKPRISREQNTMRC